MQEFLDSRQTAKLIGCKKRQLILWERDGKIRVAKKNRRGHRMYAHDEIMAFIATHPRYGIKRDPYVLEFTTATAGKVLGLTAVTVQRRALEGEITHVMRGNRVIIHEIHLKEYLEKHREIRPVWPIPEEILLTINQAARYLSVGPRKLRDWVTIEKKIPFVMVKSRHMITQAELEMFALENEDLVPHCFVVQDMLRRQAALRAAQAEKVIHSAQESTGEAIPNEGQDVKTTETTKEPKEQCAESSVSKRTDSTTGVRLIDFELDENLEPLSEEPFDEI